MMSCLGSLSDQSISLEGLGMKVCNPADSSGQPDERLFVIHEVTGISNPSMNEIINGRILLPLS